MHSNAGEGDNVKTVSLHQQMDLRDSLPLDLRELVGRAPVAVDLEVIFQIWQRFGPGAKAEIEAVFDVEFPGWRDPACALKRDRMSAAMRQLARLQR